MTNGCLIPHEVAARSFHDAFSLFVGRGKRFQCSALAAATGIGQRTVESYLTGQSTPGLAHYHTLCAVLGEAFANATMRHLSIEVRSTEPDGSTPYNVLAEAGRFVADLAGWLEDGRIDHTERPQLQASVAGLQESLSRLAANLNEERPR